MRDGLTFLAGLVLLALLAALVGPVFVDWSQQRHVIEERLKQATGLDIASTGPIDLRFLPTPRLKIAGLRVGDADPQGSRLTSGMVRAELELGPLLRGEVRLASVQLDTVDLTLAIRDGGLAMPASMPALGTVAGINIITVSRGQVTVLDEAGVSRFSAPFSAETNWPQGAAPARLEAELAGRSLRMTAGDRDAAGRVRMKLASFDPQSRIEFDGWLGIEAQSASLTGARQLMLRPEGQLLMSLAKSGEAQSPPAVSGKLQWASAGLSLTGLVVDMPGGRLEGEASWSTQPGEPARLALQARRADAEAWLAQTQALQASVAVPDWLAALLPDLQVKLSADQIGFRGEEATEAQLVLHQRGRFWLPESGRITFAGANLSFSRREQDRIAASLDAPDLRRIALAMQRLDMPQGLAEDIAALGQLAATAELAPAAGGVRITRWQARGRFGQADGDGMVEPGKVRASAAFQGADVLFLVRPLLAATKIVTADLDLLVSGQGMRVGNGPIGSGLINAQRTAGQWRIDNVTARGFDGLELDVRRGASDQDLQFSLGAPRADVITALAERLIPSQQVTQAVRALRGVSPVRLGGVVTARASDWLISATGQAGPLAVEASMRTNLAGHWQGGDVTLTAAERGVLFRALGLPAPATGNVATRLSLRLGESGPTLLMTGAEGLAFEARGQWAKDAAGTLAGPLDATVTAPVMAMILPDLGLGPVAAGGLAGRLKLRLQDGAIGLDAIEADMSGGRVQGEVEVAGSGALSGRLRLPGLDLDRFGRWAMGAAPAQGEGVWSGARFADAPRLPTVKLALASGNITAPFAGAMAGELNLTIIDGLVRLSDIRLAAGPTTIRGSVEVERQGGLLSLRVAGQTEALDLARTVGGDFSGVGDLTIQLGASGESPARLVAALTGAAQFNARNLALDRVDPSALERITANLNTDIMVSDAPALAQTVRRTVEAGSWRLADASLALVIAGGVARLSPVADEKAGASLTLLGSFDIRSGTSDLRAVLQMKSQPKGWTGPAPQIGVNWRGGWREPVRSYDVSALSNAVSQRALQREIERVEAFEADIRERAQFNRRLRAERERREEERRQAAAEAQRLAAEAQRATAEAQRLAAEAQRAAAEASRQASIEAARQREEHERARAGTQQQQPAQIAPPLPPPISVPNAPQPRGTPLPPPLNLNPSPAQPWRTPQQTN